MSQVPYRLRYAARLNIICGLSLFHDENYMLQNDTMDNLRQDHVILTINNTILSACLILSI